MGPKSLYLATPLGFNSPDGGVPLERSPQNFLCVSTDGQGTKCRRKIAENFDRVSRVHKRYRQMTDGWAIAYSECECEFTFNSRSLKIK